MRLLETVTLLLSLLAATDTHAQIVVKAEVGLDQPTRQTIEALPKELRDQMLALLKDALPLIKEDIDHYIKEINHSVEQQLLNFQCSGTGMAAEFKDQFKGVFSNPKGPLSQLAADEKLLLSHRAIDSTPRFYADTYGDLYHESAVARCQMQISGASENAVGYETKYKRLDFIWLPLIDRCKNTYNCLETVLRDTQEFVRAADRQDVEFVQAEKQLSALKLPPPPRQSVWDSIWPWNSFDPSPYENGMDQLLSIQRKVAVAKVRRELIAKELIDGSQSQVNQASAEIAQAEASVADIRKSMNVTVRFVITCLSSIRVSHEHSDRAASELSTIDDSLTKALSFDSANQSASVERMKQQVQSIRIRIGQVNTFLGALGIPPCP